MNLSTSQWHPHSHTVPMSKRSLAYSVGAYRFLLWLLAGLFLASCSPPDFESIDAPIPLPASGKNTALANLAETGSTHFSSQILFGDLHAHSQYSMDALQNSLPIYGGIRRGTVADACDFARYCSRLDFWSINDHASMLTDARWLKTKEAIRACQSGDTQGDAMVSFLGWEWTQIAKDSLNHFGHKNILLRDLHDEAIPFRPVNAGN